ncbi:MAG: TetR/AcrR family transcriptional regulator [Thauera sp.]|nr:TetR/AcrR family transcriptional regulator [Thauera sp.]
MNKARNAKEAAQQGDLRERLLDEAITILEAQGPEALTLRAVAGAAGVSHMAPYRHFADKEALLAAIAERGFRALSAAMGDAGRSGQDLLSQLHAFGLAYLAFARRRPALYRLMFGPALAGKPQYAALAQAGGEAFAHCADAVAAILRERAVVADAEPQALAVATWALVHGLAMLLIDGRLAITEGGAEEDALIAHVLALHARTFRG